MKWRRALSAEHQLKGDLLDWTVPRDVNVAGSASSYESRLSLLNRATENYNGIWVRGKVVIFSQSER